jgi:hypothetical protein
MSSLWRDDRRSASVYGRYSEAAASSGIVTHIDPKEAPAVPVKTVRISSLSGDVIPDGTGARIRVMFTDPERVDMRADLTDEETVELARQFNAEPVETRPERRARRIGR